MFLAIAVDNLANAQELTAAEEEAEQDEQVNTVTPSPRKSQTAVLNCHIFQYFCK